MLQYLDRIGNIAAEIFIEGYKVVELSLLFLWEFLTVIFRVKRVWKKGVFGGKNRPIIGALHPMVHFSTPLGSLLLSHFLVIL
jgi:hypothetical protein